jgi:hypothetical protein
MAVQSLALVMKHLMEFRIHVAGVLVLPLRSSVWKLVRN